MTATRQYPIVLHADQEHSGLRTAVFILLFVTLVVAFLGIRALIAVLNPEGLPDYTFVTACGGAFPIAIAVIWAAEKLMKRYWPSGRFVTLTPNGIQTKTEEGETVEITNNQGIMPLFWQFDLRGWQRGGRERRVPRNWRCLSAALKAGKEQIIIYTYLPPQKAANWLDAENETVQFHEILPREVDDNSIRSRLKGPSRPEIPPAVLTGQDGTYWLAERRRWTEGFELPPKEFEQFMRHIQATMNL